MKIIVVGLWHWNHYEEAFCLGLENNGIKVIRLPFGNYFNSRLSRIFLVFPFPVLRIIFLNFRIISSALKNKPDVVFFWLPTVIFPVTIRILNKLRIKTVTYNNDNPFTKNNYRLLLSRFQWFWYHKCLKYSHFNFFYRRENIEQSKKYNTNNPYILLPYYIPWRDFPISLNIEEKEVYSTDVVFVGHFEDDGRDSAVLTLIENGINLKIWGSDEWNQSEILKTYTKNAPVRSVEGVDYIKALCGAEICLAFLSKYNRDTYTRRCFEIPACGRLMLAERTDDLMLMFKEDEEACFFSTTQELLDKVTFLINNPIKRNQIANAGFRRVQASKHDVISRSKEFLEIISKS